MRNPSLNYSTMHNSTKLIMMVHDCFSGSMSGTKGGAQTTTGAQKAAPTQTSAGNVNAQSAGAKKGFTGSSGFTVKALYDYTAADKDEVSDYCC